MEITMDLYPKYLSKEKRKLHNILAVLLAASCIVYTVMRFRNASMGSVTVGDINFNITFCLALLVGGLLGHFWGLFSTFVIFNFCISYDINNSYIIFLYLFACFLAFRLCSRGIFARLGPTVLAAVMSTIILNNLWSIFYFYLNTGVVHFEISEQTILFVGGFPEILLSYLLIYLIIRFAPDSIRELFTMTHRYSSDYDQSSDIKLKKNGLEKKVTTSVFVLVTIVLMSTLFLGLGMFGLLKNDSNIYEDAETIVVTKEVPNLNNGDIARLTADKNTYYKEYLINYNNNKYAVYIKLVMMLMCIIIPLINLYTSMMKRSVLYPIIKITSYMQSFAKTTDLNRKEYADSIHEIMPHGRDEIRDLYDSLHMLVEDVNRYIEKIQEEQRLKEDLQVAKSANEAKSIFLSNMSHEIRTPINAVLGMDEMILRETKEPETAKYANDIRTASKTLLGIINDVLDFSKIESGKMEIVPVEYELYSTINDLINMTKERAKGKNLDIKLNVNRDIPHILYGDELRIKQCTINILTNAVKYTEKGEVVLDISYRVEDDHNIILMVKVTDTGSGIKKEDMDKLFAPFERIDEAHHKTEEGTGLGMSIVRNLLQKMDSELQVDSVYGKGSTFGFGIRQKVISWEPIGNFEKQYNNQKQYIGGYHEAFHAPDARILIVDDTDMNHTVMKGLLKETQIVIDSVMSGYEALEKVKTTKYDIMFIDHRMPGLDGIETLEKMCEMPDNINQGVPTIALTANVVSGAREKYINAGFSAYMSKPVEGIKLEEMLIQLLPKEKIHMEHVEELSSEDIDGILETNKEMDKFMKYVPEDMNFDLALKNCGDKSVFLEVASDYRDSGNAKMKEIQNYYDTENWENYTIKVHALKSSSRIIGEEKLADMAAEQEARGNNNDIDGIRQNHGSLMKQFESCITGLDFMLSHLGYDTTDDADKEVITREQFKEAENGLREFIEAFDFDSADGIMEMLQDYKIPDELDIRYHKIKELMAAVDRDELLKLLSE